MKQEIVFDSFKNIASSFEDVFDDIRSGWSRRELWLLLGWRDVVLRYRRSKLGTLWVTISMGVVAAALGSLYSRIMELNPHDYIPYLVIGWAAWYLISVLITDGCQVFVANASAIKEINVPKSIYVYRAVWRNLIIFAHNILIYIVLIFGFQVWPTFTALLIIPALLILLVNGMWVGMLLGTLNVKYRDIAQIIGNAMRLMFFVTPIIWSASSGRVPAIVIDLNPFYYFVEIIRAPLLGSVPPLYMWIVVLLITIIGWLATIFVYSRYSSRIPYWV